MNMSEQKSTLHCMSASGIDTTRIPIHKDLPFEFIIDIIISIFILLVNIILIVGQLSVKPLNVTSKLFIYLSVIDSLGVINAPLNFYLTQDTSIPCWLITLEIVFEITNRSIGFFIIFLLSSLRFLSIWKPFYQRQTGKIVKYFLIGMHVFVLATGGLSSYFFARGITVLELGVTQIAGSFFVLFYVIVTLTMNLLSKNFLERKIKLDATKSTSSKKPQHLSKMIKNEMTQSCVVTNGECSTALKAGKCKPCTTSLFKQKNTKKKNKKNKKVSTNDSTPNKYIKSKKPKKFKLKPKMCCKDETNPTMTNEKLKEKQDQWKKRKAVDTLVIITSFYFILFFPFAIYVMIGGIYIVIDVRGNFYTYFKLLRYGNIANVIGFANSGANAVIYIWRNKKIKDFYKIKFRALRDCFNSTK